MLSVSPNELVAFLVAVSFAAGLNVYATTATLGLLARAGILELPGRLGLVDDWWVIGLCGALWAVEFVADKIPAFDVLWNAGQAVVRVPVGALLAFAGAAELGPGWQIAASCAGGLIAALAAGGKTAAHASVAPSPEPFSNIFLSLAEDAFTIFIIWFATAHPFIAAAIVLGALAVIIILIRTVIAAIRRLTRLTAD